MPVTKSDTMPLRSEHDIVLARQTIRKVTQEMGFSLVDQTKMVTAASELSRNVVIHGGGGLLKWENVLDEGREGLRLTFSDQGPGIKDVALAMKDGWTSGKGLGMGLPGSKRLVNEFEIDSKPGAGTRVTIIRWKDRNRIRR
jgi:serine/threonine-protein kinase RsbT